VSEGDMSAERERLAALESQIEDLAGNGQPGRIGRIEQRVERIEVKMDCARDALDKQIAADRDAREKQGRNIYIGIGVLAALQFLALAGQLRFLKP
jgi:hypothetical protein